MTSLGGDFSVSPRRDSAGTDQSANMRKRESSALGFFVGVFMEKRKAISKRTRFEVFKRDGFKCQYCGSAPPQVILHVDHIKPVKEGGKNNVDNLITSCQPCNLGKGAVPLDRLPISLKEKAAAVKEMEAQIAGYAQVISQQQARIEN